MIRRYPRSLTSEKIETSKTISEKLSDYERALSNLKNFSYVSFPEGKILETISYTADIDRCCAFVIFNEAKQYILGHFNSESYENKGTTIDLFKDKIPNLLLELKKVNHDTSPLKAILVGGNKRFFNKTKAFLSNECKIQIIGTYLDEYDTSNFIEPSLYQKTLIFYPNNKTGVILTPLLIAASEILNGKDISPYKNYQNILALRRNTLLHYDSLIGMDTSFFPTKNDLKINGPISDKTYSVSVLESVLENEILTPVIDKLDQGSDSDIDYLENEGPKKIRKTTGC